ncbi:hypothetical protein AGMMS49545_13300 [Betaproteobacteria bacterium]|nr:hypothetical protein AGMMS49545_13300 [Betaproteobacteria bacterium]GHU39816.1 hypothetical protein AGMMS50289_00220 [Betaproteobacteria bacterium]
MHTIAETDIFIRYAKAKFDNLPAGFLARLKEEVEYGQGNATIH